MLDAKDLEAIAKLMDEKIGASETRMMAHMEEKISASEARIMKHVKEEISTSESRVMALMEGHFDPKFNLLVDQFKLLQEKLTPAEVVEDLDDRVDALETVTIRHTQEIEMLKKAQ